MWARRIQKTRAPACWRAKIEELDSGEGTHITHQETADRSRDSTGRRIERFWKRRARSFSVQDCRFLDPTNEALFVRPRSCSTSRTKICPRGVGFDSCVDLSEAPSGCGCNGFDTGRFILRDLMRVPAKEKPGRSMFGPSGLLSECCWRCYVALLGNNLGVVKSDAMARKISFSWVTVCELSWQELAEPLWL
jgi:hypothetical protein